MNPELIEKLPKIELRIAILINDEEAVSGTLDMKQFHTLSAELRASAVVTAYNLVLDELAVALKEADSKE